MPISHAFAKAQIVRLNGTVDYHFRTQDGGAGLKELISTLELHVGTEGQAQATISRCLEASPRCPSVFELIEMAIAVKADATRPRQYTGCTRCNGAGFEVWQNRDGAWVGRRCACQPPIEAKAKTHGD
jgi:hypothetical protein